MITISIVVLLVYFVHKIMEKLLSNNNKKLIVVYVLVLSLVALAQLKYVTIPQIYANTAIPEGARQRIVNGILKFQFLTVPITILVMFVRLLLVSLCLYIGRFFEYFDKAKFRDSWNIVVKADVVPTAFSIAFCAFYIAMGISDATNVIRHLSLAFLVDVDTAESWLVTLATAVSINELVYWIALIILAKFQYCLSLAQASSSVVLSYGIGYILYIALIVFLSLYLS